MIRPLLNGRIEPLWKGETVVCIASGPSLTADDVHFINGKARAIVINTTYALAPWADCLYACDGKWWRAHQDAASFKGMKVSLDADAARFGAIVLKSGTVNGLSKDPSVLCTGRNSGYQAINLAFLLGAARIVLLGYDMQYGPNRESHWHGDHPTGLQVRSDYAGWLKHFDALAGHLREAGIDVVNCTRRTALEMFPRLALEDALVERQEAVA